jgi:hypothetical protein
VIVLIAVTPPVALQFVLQVETVPYRMANLKAAFQAGWTPAVVHRTFAGVFK